MALLHKPVRPLCGAQPALEVPVYPEEVPCSLTPGSGDGERATAFMQQRRSSSQWRTQETDSSRKASRLRIAETYVSEANWKHPDYPNGDMIAVHFYDEAIQAFSGIEGTGKRVNVLKGGYVGHPVFGVAMSAQADQIKLVFKRFFPDARQS